MNRLFTWLTHRVTGVSERATMRIQEAHNSARDTVRRTKEETKERAGMQRRLERARAALSLLDDDIQIELRVTSKRGNTIV